MVFQNVNVCRERGFDALCLVFQYNHQFLPHRCLRIHLQYKVSFDTLHSVIHVHDLLVHVVKSWFDLAHVVHHSLHLHVTLLSHERLCLQVFVHIRHASLELCHFHTRKVTTPIPCRRSLIGGAWFFDRLFCACAKSHRSPCS